MLNRLALQRDTDEEVREFLQNNLHLQGKVLVPLCYMDYQKTTCVKCICWSSALCCGQVDNPSMRWQMALYKEMAGKAEDADAPVKVVKRVQEVSAVLYHLEMVSQNISSGKRVPLNAFPVARK